MQEHDIGVLYIFSLATSILILDRSPHGIEEFKNILNGNIIWVSGKEVLSTLILYGVIGLFHYIFKAQFFRLSCEGYGHFIWEFLFFLSFAAVLVKSVQMAGILQVFAFLIIPALGILRQRFRSVCLLQMGSSYSPTDRGRPVSVLFYYAGSKSGDRKASYWKFKFVMPDADSLLTELWLKAPKRPVLYSHFAK